VFLQASRRGEELRVRLNDEADKLAALPTGDRLAVAEFLHTQAQAALAANEVLALIDRLAPAYADLPKGDYLRQRWMHHRANALTNAGRADEALGLWKELAAANPTDYSAQSQYANALFNRGDHEAALAWLRQQFAAGRTQERWTADWLRGQYADWLERLGRFPELIAFTREWTEQVPETDAGYARHLSALVRGGEAERRRNWSPRGSRSPTRRGSSTRTRRSTPSRTR
jgi:tetratricopeptide (TPR) repeat protein